LVLVPATKDLHGCPVGCQPIGHDPLGRRTLVLEQFPEQIQSRHLVAALLDEDTENLAFLVDGAPHEHPLAVDPDHPLVQMPHGVCSAALATDVGRDAGPNLFAQQRTDS
jgi:hypothetical protein